MQTSLIDPYMRRIEYLRVSVTDRCDFRCVYCMSDDMTFLPKKEVLSLEELQRLCSVFIGLGVKKLRITGGEPLVRRDIMHLFQHLGRHVESGDLEELTVTTNASQLSRYATDLYASGVRRVNVSIDSLNEKKFTDITRRGKLPTVLEGIAAAKKAGLKVKINCVALQGINDDEVFDFINWCDDNDCDLTFIEVMPMGDIGNENRVSQYLPLSALREKIETRETLRESSHRSGGPARYFDLVNRNMRLGFITPLTHNFCELCNRVRLTCTGKLYMCLGQDDNADLRSVLREADDEAVRQAIISAIRRKPKGHDFIIDRNETAPSQSRHMSVTGG